MRRSNILILLFAFLLYCNSSGQEIANIEKIELESKILNQKRPVLIYTPKEYNERDLVCFDVFYVFDAQNREKFDLVHSLLNYTFSNKQYLVVGITSPSYPEIEYYRNNDYLPKPTYVKLEEYHTANPNSENFWNYVENELVPYIESHYRTTKRRFAIGHSLSASFVLDRAIKNSEFFSGFISVSPNLAYDEFRLVKDFINFDFISNENKFIYISQANELTDWNPNWGKGYKMLQDFLKNRNSINNYTIFTNEFPNQDHQNTYPVSLLQSIKILASFLDKNPLKPNGKFKDVIIRVHVPKKSDDAFIAGNQITLGNWNPSEIKLKRVSDFKREIKVKVQFPIEFKITRGSWESQAYTNQSTNDGENILIANPIERIDLKVNAWNDSQY